MPVNFNFGGVVTNEFGVGIDEPGGQRYYFVPSDTSVQMALREMTIATRDAIQTVDITEYDPADKHAGEEPCTLALTSPLASGIRSLHEANNLPTNADALASTEQMFCYFVRLGDGEGRRLTGVRRATQFKGVLKSHLVLFGTNALKLVEDRVFKLDRDFDFIVDSEAVHILRPSGFEFVGKLQKAVLDAVSGNVATAKTQLSFVEFKPIEDYAKKHPRAARYLASILSQPISHVARARLRAVCKANGVEVESKNGRMVVSAGHEMGFLEVLDRRRYELELVEGSPERYRAASRSKV